MLIFDLVCENEHRFEGWFHGIQDFDSQLERDMISCPCCGNREIRKLPSAVSIALSRGQKEKGVSDQVEKKKDQAAILPANPSSTHVKGLYRQLAQAMIAVSEDVGSAFAEEARRIHYQETPERPIRGQATDKEYEELSEEGIAVMRLPDFSDKDLN